MTMLPRHVARLLLIGIDFGLFGIFLLRAEEVTAVPAVHYLDEESGRMVTIREAEPPAVTVEIRFPSDPGYPFVWLGKGTREDNRIVFSRVVGEEEPPGSRFEAKTGSRLEIVFAPDQLSPVDEGFLGEHRRLSEDKRFSLAMKELKAANEALETAQRKWGKAKDPALLEWNRRWPTLRAQWTTRNQLNAAIDPAAPPKDSDAAYLLVATTGQAIGFFNQEPPAGPIPPDGSGNYDDGFGGGATLRSRSDGSFRVGFGWQRGDLEAMGSDFSFDLPAAAVKRERGSEDWTAEYLHPDPEAPAGSPQARIRLRKTGRFLQVEAIDASRLTGPGWVDGIYRWGPIPVEG
jgi:hypothetical protein